MIPLRGMVDKVKVWAAIWRDLKRERNRPAGTCQGSAGAGCPATGK